MADELLSRRARNLYVISGTIIVSVLAGVSVQDISLLGLREDAIRPQVYTAALVVVFFWMWWRYRVARRASSVHHEFIQDYIRSLNRANNSKYLQLLDKHIRSLEKLVVSPENGGVDAQRYNLDDRFTIKYCHEPQVDGERKRVLLLSHFHVDKVVYVKPNPDENGRESRYEINYTHTRPAMMGGMNVIVPPRFDLGRRFLKYVQICFRTDSFADYWGAQIFAIIAAAVLIYSIFSAAIPNIELPDCSNRGIPF